MDILKSLMFEKEDPLAHTNATLKTGQKNLGTVKKEDEEKEVKQEEEKEKD